MPCSDNYNTLGTEWTNPPPKPNQPKVQSILFH